MTDTRTKVRTALENLSNAANKPGQFFSSWISAARVAAEAGVSVTTARKYLDELAGCRGYAKRRFPHGDLGYRCYKDA
jgi:response regulator of citrate/malate metabolism